MMDLERLFAFALMTFLTSVVPGPSVLFVMSQTIWRGARSGWAALIGLQVGYLFWWALAALGLGSLARAFPLAFQLLAIGGAAYIGWLGVQAIRHAGEAAGTDGTPARQPSIRAFRDGILVAIGNPKALIYVVALLPPFVDADRPILPQLGLLVVIGSVLDLVAGGAYIFAGNRLARAMDRQGTRKWIDRAVGAVFVVIAVAILAELLLA
jgi:threonine/homoserine/homoserine lactone efflux protein